MSRRQTRAAAAAAAAADAPRPRRRAAVRAAASTEVQRNPPTWTQSTGMALVGKAIDVWWQPEETFYRAIVLSYNPRRHQHKVIYLEDETVEMLELGDGPEQRAWQYGEQPKDSLVGKDLVFLRDEADEEDEPAWFDFMRGPREKKGQKFTVKVYAKLTTEPDPDEVCSPLPDADDDKNVEHEYYRVIHLANEFLATVDLAHVKYRIESETGEDEERTINLVSPPRQRSALPAGSRRTGSAGAGGEEPYVVEEEPAADVDGEDDDDDDDKDGAYVPGGEGGDDSAGSDDDQGIDGKGDRRKRVGRDVDVDDEARDGRAEREEKKKVKVKVEKKVKRETAPDVDVDVDLKPLVREDSSAKRTKASNAVPVDDGDADVEMTDPPEVQTALAKGAGKKDNGREKAVTVDRPAGVDRDPHFGGDKPATAVEVNPDDSMNVSSLEDEATGAKVKDEGSVGTQDTHDEPLDRGRLAKDKLKSRGPLSVPQGVLPDEYDDEAKTHDTASDERKLGWVSEERKGPGSTTVSQVGDYISLDTGDGKEPRKAFVEAYLPAHDEHFVAFCDSKGGNMKIRLTKTNHTLLSDEEVQELNRKQITSDEPLATSNGQRGKLRGKRRRNGRTLTLTDTKPKKRREPKMEVKGDTAGAEVCGRCLKIVWPGSDLVYTALVLGYSSKTKQHMVVYLSDHCVEFLELKYREWNLLAKEDEPWIAQGMVGKRLYVFWEGVYDDPKAQEKAEKLFGEDESRVPYEAYVLSYEGGRKYKILYPATEDTETRELKVEGDDDEDPTEKEWDILEQGQTEVGGLPVLCWSE